MTLNVSLNKKSITKAIKKLESTRKKLATEKVLAMLYSRCYEYFKERAIFYVEQSEIGSDVKNSINSSWEFQQVGTVCTIRNFADKAVWVEFGVGVIGESQSHPSSNEAGYEYNVPSAYKKDDGEWVFFSDEKDLDIPKSALLWGQYGSPVDDRGRMIRFTKGTKGVWYAYNALTDLYQEVPRIYEELLKEILV